MAGSRPGALSPSGTKIPAKGFEATIISEITKDADDPRLQIGKFQTHPDTRMTSTAAGRALERQELVRRLRRVHAIARVMDTAIRIPGTGIRFGADSVMGLIPGIGDAGGALIGLVIVNEARRLGVSNQLLLKMLANIGLDTFAGSVPVIGDLFDVYFKSNWRNMQLLLEHFGMDEAELFAGRR
jgi:Domain of unknown function (DUF4112)